MTSLVAIQRKAAASMHASSIILSSMNNNHKNFVKRHVVLLSTLSSSSSSSSSSSLLLSSKKTSSPPLPIEAAAVVSSTTNRTTSYRPLSTAPISSLDRTFLTNDKEIQQQTKLFLYPSQYNSQRRYFASYPPHQIVGLPSLSPTMESGSIASWNVKVGDSFGPGESLCSVETDKATVDFEAQDDGVVGQILVPAGEGIDIKVGDPIMIVIEDAADVPAFASYTLADATGAGKPSSPPPTSAATPAPTTPTSTAATTTTSNTATPPVASPTTGGSRPIASPLAHMLAKDMGYSINNIQGTGPGGRIIAADVREYIPSLAAIETAAATSTATTVPAATGSSSIPPISLPSPPIAGVGYTDYPLSESARNVAARLMQSKRNVPHYYLTVDVCVDEILKLRSTLNSSNNSKDDEASIGVYELLIKAAAKSMQTVPSVNASWLESVVRVYDSVDINIVVGSGDTLYTPVLRNCSTKGIQALSDEVRNAVTAAGNDTASGSTIDDSIGTFTIMNLGMYGIKSCAPIIREPQSCSLAIGAIENRIVPKDTTSTTKGTDDDNELYQQSAMVTVTMSCDHRVVDGAVGAQWLSTFKSHVEHPMTLLL